MSTTSISTAEPGSDDDGKMPALKHRPRPLPTPLPARNLTSVRSALQRNQAVNLPDEAASVITGGLTDPDRFKLLVEPYPAADGGQTSLLNSKRVGEGDVFVTQQHDRFIDIGVIPDLAGARWAHTLLNQLDNATGERPAANLTTATGPNNRPYAMLELQVADHQEFAARIREAFVRTLPDNSTVGNDYTASVLQSGVKEPLLLVPIRIRFADGSADEYYLVAIDGNSRLVSMWKGRVGGKVDDAATACIETVVGTITSKSVQRASARHVRDQLTSRIVRVNKGLKEAVLSEATIRAGHTTTAPSVVVVGGLTTDGAGPLTDLVAAREDVIATIHTDATPWGAVAQAEQGMARLLRRALNGRLITADERMVIEGRCTVEQMHATLGVPAHRLWAVAVTLRAILTTWYPEMRTLFAEEFNNSRPNRLAIGKQIAATALSGYRSWEGYGVAVNAFADGGPISEQVWETTWKLTQGETPFEVLDAVLRAALDGDQSAIAELCVLGGAAAMLDGLITRDRGSKLNPLAGGEVRYVPLRMRPYRVVEELAKSKGGLKTLHSLAVAHINEGIAKQFHTHNDPEGTFVDGDPVMDLSDVQAEIYSEWHIVYAADPQRSQEAIDAATKDQSGGGDGKPTEPEAVKLRRMLLDGAQAVQKATLGLATLSQSQGKAVFGGYENVEAIKVSLQESRDVLNTYGPAPRVIIADDPDDDEVEGALFGDDGAPLVRA
ncbi:hypothetical protein [Amycolatopsis sp. CA-126428]|uniref:hypothetical protein n=1 Tax=Amycolatopsis sp. CA-126428 TaxID=2073158 RepID=UPI0011B0038F|nr:hypothetical protein [Amycolatopsis sp. CA-126428]